MFSSHHVIGKSEEECLSVSDYFNKVKELVDTMAMLVSPLAEDDMVSYVLYDLGSNYNPIVIDHNSKTVSLD